MTVEQQLIDIIASEYSKSEEDIRGASNWTEMGLDSLDTVELIMKIEDTFKITIEDEEAQELKSLADMVALVTSKV
jgi:acyl carrier protein